MEQLPFNSHNIKKTPNVKHDANAQFIRRRNTWTIRVGDPKPSDD